MISPIRLGICVLSFGVFNGVAASNPIGRPITLVESGTSRCVIVYGQDSSLSARTAKRLAEYLKQQTDAEVPSVAENQFDESAKKSAVILIDGSKDAKLARRFGVEGGIKSERQDAFVLKTVSRKTGPPVILLAGKSAEGAKYAAYRLMREMEVEGHSARLKDLEVRAEPMIKTRSVALFNVWGMPIQLTRRHNTESWSMEDLERYIDLYDFYGFNAIESHDRFNDNYLEPLFGIRRAEWRAKVQQMAAHAHENGQQFFLRIWGHTVMQTPRLNHTLGPNESVPKRLKYLCPNDPEQRREWEGEIRDYYVTNYAGRIDNLIGHWCDPGVCRENGCTYRTPLELQMELHRAFKARDPRFHSTFSLWYFDRTKDNPASWARRGWPGYGNDLDLVNAGVLDKEVMIATMTQLPGSYRDDVVQAILRAGHKPAVWTWYRADHEIRPSLHVHLHERLGEYFKSLPASARELEWHNIERNVHGAANTVNYYVAGRLMWDPKLDVNDLLMEFLSFAFGPANAARIAPAYQAIEKIRCHSCALNWESTTLTGAGTDDPLRDQAEATAALARLSEVKIPRDFRPRIPLDVPPQTMLSDLRSSLEVIRDFANCRARELPVIETAWRSGEEEKVHSLAAGLRAKYGGWRETLAGRQEWAVLQNRLKRLEVR